jgi:hypothetical protein
MSRDISIWGVAERLYAALRLRPCTCLYNVPYPDSHVKREVTNECSRCKAMKEYEAIRDKNVRVS